MADKCADFGNYKAKAVKADAEELFTFHDLEGEPTLSVKPATRHNRRYAAAAKAQGAQLRRLMRGSAQDADKKAVKLLASLFSKTVVTGWPTPPIDSKGKPVDFTAENCEAFLNAIPDYMFDDPSKNYPSLVDFCTNPQNFVGGGETVEEVELLGKT